MNLSRRWCKLARACPLLTGRGFALLLGSICIPLAALVFNLPIALTLGLVTLYLVGLCALFFHTWLTLRRLAQKIRIKVEVPSHLICGRTATFTVHPHLHAPHSHRPVATPYTLCEKPRHPASCHIERTHCTISFQATQTIDPLHHSVTPFTRGTFTWDTVDIRLTYPSSPLTLQGCYRAAAPLKAECYPDHAHGALQSVAAADQFAPRNIVFVQAGGEGREFDSLRRYAVGDDLRRVDWKRSARTGELVVRTYRPEANQRILVSIDAGRRMNTWSGDRLQLEFAINAAAGLLSLAAENGDSTGLHAFHHEECAQLLPGKGQRHRMRALQLLKDIALGSFESDYTLPAKWGLKVRRRSLFVLITTLSSPAAIESIEHALRGLRHSHLPLLAAIADHDLQELQESPAKNLEDAYVIAAAAEQHAQITQKLGSLSSSGIASLYCRAHELPAALERKYMQLKVMGQL